MRKMMSSIVFTLACSLLNGRLLAAGMEEAIKARAQKCVQATADDDYEGIVACTHPLVIEMNGGKEHMLSILQQGSADMKSSGADIESVEIGEPQQLGQMPQLSYALVPQTIRMKVPQGKLIQDGWLLAISTDQGSSWNFVDATNLTDATLGQVFPELAGKIKLPAKTAPRIEEN